ncbi:MULTISPECIES: response regulator transcription factor [Streptomyces]|jgi:DNA-binding response OmpR family regulator|uniref:Sensory transduction protein RegX3 n=1 Tax=Streptomyces thermogriseus TaxID=75292 RepID=A0ABP4DRX0_9ACTN|nr:MULTISPECIES: response regulator transcription factor [unclassified Streptomyces]MDN5385625.1 response regulator transcription factor [Streptomyces sp. LB8]
MSQQPTELMEFRIPASCHEESVAPNELATKPGIRNLPGPTTTWRILVVENNAAEADALVSALKRHGHEVESVATGGAALQSYGDADLVLIDLELPDLDGLEVCRSIRSACDIPVIAVTARGSELDRVLGLQAGADDYLVKPYGFRELMARMEAVMRRARTSAPTSRVISHGPLRIDAGFREVTLHGRVIDLTRKEFDLLYMLASNPGTVIPRKQLIRQIWGDSWSRRTVDTHVSSLRNKLGGSDWIVTVRGVGFRFGGVSG